VLENKLKERDKKGSLRGAKPHLRKTLPLPLDRGRGIKGDGVDKNIGDSICQTK
jgi:hypothetical protein